MVPINAHSIGRPGRAHSPHPSSMIVRWFFQILLGLQSGMFGCPDDTAFYLVPITASTIYFYCNKKYHNCNEYQLASAHERSLDTSTGSYSPLIPYLCCQGDDNNGSCGRLYWSAEGHSSKARRWSEYQYTVTVDFTFSYCSPLYVVHSVCGLCSLSLRRVGMS